ncbi:hypothetical protein AQUCO_00900037v1 [Aquilegia coerulea]|uniref:Uncharacterized protein n=1 Tax=Aquilegia coerulea TaxID=218851 RepID=A0A2G5EC67_AQUCA|nr:hypothetical protein AQUCO_00900037v1 [Aquilegia coerulea]
MAALASSSFLAAVTTTTTTTTTTTRLLGFQTLKPKSLLIIPPISCASKLRANSSILSHKLSFRFSNVESLLWRKDRYTVFANPTEGDIVEKKTQGTEADASQGPPFLTILAGFIVVLLIFWIVGSIVMWLVGLIVNVPSSK